MAEFPALPLFTDAYLADTGHLSDAEHGRYFMMLVTIWRSPECRIPDDDAWLARRFRRPVESVRSELRPLIAEFMTSDGSWITQKRLRKEWDWCKRRSRTQSLNAKSRWSKDKDAGTGDAATASAGSGPAPTDGSAPEATAARAGQDNREKRLFERGKQVLGKNAGGLIAALLKAKGGSVELAAAALEVAGTKQDPREFVAACSRAPPRGAPQSAKDQRTQDWHDARKKLREYAYRDQGSGGGCGPPVRLLPSVGGE